MNTNVLTCINTCALLLLMNIPASASSTLCDEVATQLDIAVQENILTADEAAAVEYRCRLKNF